MSALFPILPAFPVRIPDDELRLLARLPDYAPNEAVTQIDHHEEAACRRLEKRGLAKVKRWKDDPINIRRTMYAGRIYTGPKAADL